MASIVVRGLDDSVKEQLAAQARKHGRSMEAEVRAILAAAVQRPNIAIALMQVGQEFEGIEEFEVPARTDQARAVRFD